MLESLDIESQSWRDGVDVFSVETFQDGRLTSIVQAA